MIKSLRGLFSLSSPAPAAAAVAPAAPAAQAPHPWQHARASDFSGHHKSRGASAPVGIPAINPDDLLVEQGELIAKIRHSLGLPTQAFDRYVMEPLRRFASFVHLLPASEYHHHHLYGGLLRHSIEVAELAAHYTENMVFATREEPAHRRELEPRYRVAMALAGLLHDVGKPISDMAVTDLEGTKEWSPHLGSVYEWLVENNLPAYTVRWREDRRHQQHKVVGLTVIDRIIGRDTARFLAAYGEEVVDYIYDSVSPINDPNGTINPLTKMVVKADGESVERETKAARASEVGTMAGGRHKLVNRVMAAIRNLAQSASAAPPNTVGQPFWVTDKGVFCQYPLVLEEATKAMRSSGEIGMPAANKLVGILADARFISMYTSGATLEQEPIWHITVPVRGASGSNNEWGIQALKFERPEFVFGDFPLPLPIAATILPPTDHAAAAPPPPASQGMSAPSQTPAAAGDAPTETPQPVALQSGTVEDSIADDSGWVEDSGYGRAAGGIARPMTDKEAGEFLERHDTAGTYLRFLASHIAEGKLVRDRHFTYADGRLVVAFPDAFKGSGVANAMLLDLFRQAKWIDIDRAVPDRITIDSMIGSKKENSLRLTAPASAAVMVLAEAIKASAARSAQEQIEQLGIKKSAYVILHRILPKANGKLLSQSEKLLREMIGQIATRFEKGPDELWQVLMTSPKPLIVPSSDPAFADMRIDPSFDPNSISVTRAFYERYPQLE